ncbi:translation initiation factor IF-2, partial [Streptosporangium sandarakinum]
MAKLQEMGEFVRSASSTIEAPVVRRLTEALGGPAKGSSDRGGNRPSRPPQAAPRPAEGQAGTGAPAAPRSSVPRPGPVPKPGLRLAGDPPARPAVRRRPPPPPLADRPGRVRRG